jgi:hypothetical protein
LIHIAIDDSLGRKFGASFTPEKLVSDFVHFTPQN